MMNRIAAMGANLDRSPYNGTWTASCQNPEWPSGLRLRSLPADTPEAAVEDLHARWIAAGSPAPRIYTIEESIAIDVWCDSRNTTLAKAKAAGEVMTHPFVREGE